MNTVVEGDPLDQPVQVIVDARNCYVISWSLLFRQGVSGAIKRRGGIGPSGQVGMLMPIALGGAVLTSAINLLDRGVVHVAGINLF